MASLKIPLVIRQRRKKSRFKFTHRTSHIVALINSLVVTFIELYWVGISIDCCARWFIESLAKSRAFTSQTRTAPLVSRSRDNCKCELIDSEKRFSRTRFEWHNRAHRVTHSEPTQQVQSLINLCWKVRTHLRIRSFVHSKTWRGLNALESEKGSKSRTSNWVTGERDRWRSSCRLVENCHRYEVSDKLS